MATPSRKSLVLADGGPTSKSSGGNLTASSTGRTVGRREGRRAQHARARRKDLHQRAPSLALPGRHCLPTFGTLQKPFPLLFGHETELLKGLNAILALLG